jgi:rhodanese-related sulfurtransferase
MKLKQIAILLITTGLIHAVTLPIDKASPKVQELIKKSHLEIVDTAYVKEKLGKGTRVSAKAVILDARPNKKYIVGHVPTSLSIPDTKFDAYYDQIKDLDKATELIIFCGGWKCAKSPKLAAMLAAKGFTNIKVYQAGYPAWKKAGNYSEVDTAVVKSATTKGNATIIDARPLKKYTLSHIPGAIGIPDTKVYSMLDALPKDKAGKVIVYCGGYKCAKSHNLAKKLLEMGYSKVAVYAAGMPVWSKAGLPVEGKRAEESAKKSENKAYIEVNGMQLVKDQEENQNMVYGPWYLDLIKNLPAGYTLVDVRDSDSFASGHLPKAVNVPFDDKQAKAFVAKMMKLEGIVIMSCASGAMATEAITAVIDHGGDLKKIFFVDANLDCDKNNKCTIEINDPL